MKNSQLSGPTLTLEACVQEEPQANSFGKMMWNCMAADVYFREPPTTQTQIKECMDDLNDFFKSGYDVVGLKAKDMDQEILQKVQKWQKD